ncbi:MAG: hypothetical protein ACOCXG_03560, partial [Nanoarchaeota archaeon]
DSGEPKVKYVGHSNGCRSALSAFNNTNDLVETFVGIACPTTLNDVSGTGYLINKKLTENLTRGDWAIQELNKKGRYHLLKQDYGDYISFFGLLARSEYKISLKLQDFYGDLYQDSDSSFNIMDFAKNYYLFLGSETYVGLKNFQDDGAVPIKDMENLASDLTDSELYKIKKNHGEIIEEKKVLEIITEKLKNER